MSQFFERDFERDVHMVYSFRGHLTPMRSYVNEMKVNWRNPKFEILWTNL